MPRNEQANGEHLEKEISEYSQSVLGIAIDFDHVTTDPTKSRADEVRLLTINNKKQPKNSKDRKPQGVGCPTGGVESGENHKDAVLRETLDESGYGAGGKVLGEIYYEHIHRISNTVHVFLLEVDSLYVVLPRERDEVDITWDNWITLRQALSMPYAIAKDGTPKNPNGIYYGHVRRLIKALNILFLTPENLPEDAKNAVAWIDEHHQDLASAMKDLRKDGLVSLSEEGMLTLPKEGF